MSTTPELLESQDVDQPLDHALPTLSISRFSNLTPASFPKSGTRRYYSPIAERRLLLVAGDAMLAIASAFLAFAIWHFFAKHTWAISSATLVSKLYWFPIVVSLWMCLAWLYDMYDPMTAGSKRIAVLQITAISISALGVGFIAYFFLPKYSPRTFVLLFLPIMSAMVAVWRIAFSAFAGKLARLHRVLVVGAPEAVTELAKMVSRVGHPKYEIAAWGTESDIAQFYFESNAGRFADHVRASGIDEVVVSSRLGNLDNESLKALIECQGSGIRVTSMPDVYRRISRQIPVKYVDHDWVLDTFVDRPLFTRAQLGFKRMFDLAGSLIALPFVAILLPFVAAAIRFDSNGPIFYSQTRTGRGGRPFKIQKFRTMCADAESDGVARWAGDEDPRITRVGRFLRKARIDELPQLLNVLRGEMSLVGPRPERPELEANLEQTLPHYSIRHLVKPGVTGWAQIHYKYGNTTEDAMRKLQYDFYYIRYWSLQLDFYVSFRTIGVVLGFKGQ